MRFRFDPDVVRLDVAMNQPLFMRRGQPNRDLFADAGDVFGTQFFRRVKAVCSDCPARYCIAMNGTPRSSPT
jgi:hypothetical protein